MFGVPVYFTLNICSGKSTLLSTILRLLDPSNGSILIDGADISKVSRNVVRSRLICLPQDALILPGTFRFNIDPHSQCSDDKLIKTALMQVGIWDLVEHRGGLNGAIPTDSLSHGEQQLIAMARAIVRKRLANGRCILVLDEATSNLDEDTEMKIQKVVESEFRDNTVITVAHGLRMIRDADMVVVLEKGEVFKIGPPGDVL